MIFFSAQKSLLFAQKYLFFAQKMSSACLLAESPFFPACPLAYFFLTLPDRWRCDEKGQDFLGRKEANFGRKKYMPYKIYFKEKAYSLQSYNPIGKLYSNFVTLFLNQN